MSRYGNLISSGIYQSCLTSLKLTKKWSGTIMKAIKFSNKRNLEKIKHTDKLQKIFTIKFAGVILVQIQYHLEILKDHF